MGIVTTGSYREPLGGRGGTAACTVGAESRQIVNARGQYPAEIACDAITRVGTRVHLRPIKPEDAHRLVEFHEHLSLQSIYRRYFFAHVRLKDAEVERLTHVDYVDRMAIIAEEGDRLVGIGRYERPPGMTEAEVAFVVADDHHHHGIGTLLLEKLADAAWKHGVVAFVASTLVENQDMLDVFRNAGFPVETTVDGGVVSIRFLIVPDEVYRAASEARHAEAGERAAGRQIGQRD